MAKIAFVRIAHKDYQTDMSREKGIEAFKNVKQEQVQY